VYSYDVHHDALLWGTAGRRYVNVAGKEIAMPPSRILIIIVALVVVTVAGTLVFGRYFLTTSVQQRIVEQRSVPAMTATP
jgi:hypothetical protein